MEKRSHFIGGYYRRVMESTVPFAEKIQEEYGGTISAKVAMDIAIVRDFIENDDALKRGYEQNDAVARAVKYLREYCSKGQAPDSIALWLIGFEQKYPMVFERIRTAEEFFTSQERWRPSRQAELFWNAPDLFTGTSPKPLDIHDKTS